jgi:hypothetical protein
MNQLNLHTSDLRKSVYPIYNFIFNYFTDIHTKKFNNIIKFIDDILLQDNNTNLIIFLYEFLLNIKKNINFGIEIKNLLYLFLNKEKSLPIYVCRYIFDFDPYLMIKNKIPDFIFSLFFTKYNNFVISNCISIKSGFRNPLSITREFCINEMGPYKKWYDFCICTSCNNYLEIFNISNSNYISKEYNNCVKCNCFCDYCGEIKKNIYINSKKKYIFCVCNN